MYFKITYFLAGKRRTKVVKAKTQDEAIRILKKKYKRAIITDIERIKDEDLLNKMLSKFKFNSINMEEYISIIDQLYVMLDAGLGIDVTLDTIKDNIKNKRLREIFDTVYNDIKAGLSLSNSFKKFKDDLGALSIAMVEVGEETGDIAKAMRDLSDILREIVDNRKRLKKATRYPIFIIFAMMIAFVIVIMFVIPPFKALFAQLQAKLPLPTRFLLWIEYAFEKYGLMVLGGGVGIFSILVYLHNTNKKARYIMDKFMLKIYIIGEVIKLAMIGRFLFVMERLLEAGIPIIDAVDIAINIVENSYIYDRLLAIKNSIKMGGSVKQGFEESELFEPMIIQMVGAGEESGSLVLMLKKASDYYLDKYRDLVDNIAVLIEPILIAAIAGFVFTLALGIFLPMWNLTEIVK